MVIATRQVLSAGFLLTYQRGTPVPRGGQSLLPIISLAAEINSDDYSKMVVPFSGFGIKVEHPDELNAALEAGMEFSEGGKIAIINGIIS